MRGLRIDWGPTRKQRLTSKLKYRLHRDPAPDSSATPQEVLLPAYASDFSRMFGPIFPEISQRNWLLCNAMINLELEDLSFFEKEETSRAVSDLKAHILDDGYSWRLVSGEFLVRISNHLWDSEPTMHGIPSSRFHSFNNARQGVDCVIELENIAARFSDIAFTEYEGIWGAFFDDPRLLARTFYHCSELASVMEVVEATGPDGDWLWPCRRSCPNLPVLLAASSPEE